MRPRPRDSPSVSPVKGGSAIAQAGTDTARRLSGLQGGDSPDSQRGTRQVAFPLVGWVITAFRIIHYTIFSRKDSFVGTLNHCSLMHRTVHRCCIDTTVASAGTGRRPWPPGPLQM
jgi:hypothetical protein